MTRVSWTKILSIISKYHFTYLSMNLYILTPPIVKILQIYPFLRWSRGDETGIFLKLRGSKFTGSYMRGEIDISLIIEGILV